MAKQKHVIPTETDVVNQDNKLSQASYSMPVIQRRLVFLAMAQVRNDDSTRVFTMPVAAVLKALGMRDDRYMEIEEAVDDLFKRNQVKIKAENKKGFRSFTWVNEVEYIEGNPGDDITQDTLKIELNANILPFARTLQKSFHQFQISQIAKLQGRHSLRIFELVSSHMGLAGKGGNPPGVWWFEASIKEFREYLAIGPEEYKVTALLRQRVIDGPVEEINKAHLGLQIRVEYQRQGKYLAGVKFICTLTKGGDPKPAQPATKTEDADEKLIATHQEKWTEILDEELQGDLFKDTDPPAMAEFQARARAIVRLRDWAKTAGKKGRKKPE